MIAMATKQPETEINTWLRWAIGIIVTAILGLTVHIGNEGSRIKKEISDVQSVQAGHAEAFRRTDSKIDRIEDKIDKLIERK